MQSKFLVRSLAGACAVACSPAIFIAQEVIAQEVIAQEVIEEIRVTGTPTRQSPDDLAQSVTVIGGEQLDRVRAANLGETLAGELGVSASYFGTGSSRPIIRGLAGPRVRTLEDGIESLDVSSISVDHAVSIDPLAAEQIEIFRGPTTLLYGSGAVGGVINTVTNRIPDLASEDGFGGAVEVRGDTVANDRTLSLALDGAGDSVAWHLDAMTRDTDDYEIPGAAALEAHDEEDEPEGEAHHEEAVGILENSDVEIDSASGGLSWLGDTGFFGVSVSSFDTNYGLPGDHAHEHEADELVRIDLEQTRIDMKGGWTSLGGAVQAVNLRLGLADYEHVELEGEEIGTRFDSDASEGRLEIMHAPWGAWNGAFGLQVVDRDLSAIGEEAFVPPTATTSYGLFIIEQRATARWQLSLGARVESQEHVPTGGSRRVEDSATSVSLAAIRDLGGGFSLAFNTALADRLPAAEELYANGPHLASGNVEIGDPALGEETSRHFDFGLRKTEGDLSWAVTAFVTDYDDYIYLRDTGTFDAELPVFAYSQGNAEFFGLEAELFTPLAEIGEGHIELRIFADFVEGKLETGENLPRIPPRRGGARLQYHTERLLTGLELTRFDAQEKVALLEDPTPGYTMLNADLQWTVGSGAAARYDLFVRGTNLLDEDARRHTSFLKATTPLPGRNYSVGFRTSF